MAYLVPIIVYLLASDNLVEDSLDIMESRESRESVLDLSFFKAELLLDGERSKKDQQQRIDVYPLAIVVSSSLVLSWYVHYYILLPTVRMYYLVQEILQSAPSTDPKVLADGWNGPKVRCERLDLASLQVPLFLMTVTRSFTTFESMHVDHCVAFFLMNNRRRRQLTRPVIRATSRSPGSARSQKTTTPW